MGRVFLNQTKLTIKLDVKDDLSGVASAKIKFIKPDETEGEFTATLDAPNELIYYAVTSTTDLDVEGKWKFWSYIVYSDGGIIQGEVDYLKIVKAGTK